MNTLRNKPLIVITGPTASGKTSLAIKIAKKYNGEIISADSRAIYVGADVGTAKPTAKEQAEVKHWGIDLVKPNQYFSAADYKKYACEKIDEIRSRGHIPILVGGTGLYIDAVLFDYQFGPKASRVRRYLLQHASIGYLYGYCAQHNIGLPENYKNKRYIIRAIEMNGAPRQKSPAPVGNCLIVGIATDSSVLRDRIVKRAGQIFNDGAIDEARRLGRKYGWRSEAMKSNIYPLARLYIQGKISLDEAIEKFITLDWRLAKRQLTWMRRNKFIHWLSLVGAEKYIVDQLAKIEQL